MEYYILKANRKVVGLQFKADQKKVLAAFEALGEDLEVWREGAMHGWMDGCVDEWMVGCMDGRMDAWMDV